MLVPDAKAISSELHAPMGSRHSGEVNSHSLILELPLEESKP